MRIRICLIKVIRWKTNRFPNVCMPRFGCSRYICVRLSTKNHHILYVCPTSYIICLNHHIFVQLTFTCSKTKIEALKNVWNMFKLTIKTSERCRYYYIWTYCNLFLLFLLLILNTYIFAWWRCCRCNQKLRKQKRVFCKAHLKSHENVLQYSVLIEM